MKPTIRSVPAGCQMTGDAELAVAHAVPHLVVSQIHRPDVAAFLEPDKVNVKTVEEAYCCATTLTTTTTNYDVFTFASQLPHLTAFKGSKVKQCPSSTALSDLPRQLRHLEWSFCQNVIPSVVTFAAALGDFPHLTALDLSGSLDARAIYMVFVGQRKHRELRKLELRWSLGIDVEALEQIALLPSLEVLDVSYTNKMNTIGFVHLAQHAHRLTDLNLSYCPSLHQEVFTHLSAVRSLRTLTMTACSFVHGLGVERLSTLDELEVLNMEACLRIDARCLEYVSRMSGLRELDLSRCIGVNSDGLVHLAALPRLRKLGLCQCKNIDAECLRHLSNVATLEELDLSGCEDVDAEGLMYLSRLPRLKELALYECSGVDGQAIIDHLAAMPSLRVLGVDGAVVEKAEVRRCLPKSLLVVI